MSSSSQCAQHALEDMCNYLSDEGEVAIFDATNTTRERRQVIYDYCTQTFCFRVFFVESICDSKEMIEANIRVREGKLFFANRSNSFRCSQQVKLKSPDYRDVPQEEAVSDFLSRIQQYEKRYETINEKTERNFSFIKIFNCGERFLVHKIGGKIRPSIGDLSISICLGHIQSRVIYFLMNIHILPRTIYLTRVNFLQKE